MSLINKQMQIALGLEPEPTEPESKISLPVVVEPDELPLVVQNPDLPDMSDIDQRLTEGEKQLEEVIQKGTVMLETIFDDEYPNTEPRYRRGVLEQGVMIYNSLLSAIQHKTKLQMEKRKSRLAEAGFSKGAAATPGSGATTNMFFGTREQMAEMMKENGLLEEEK